MNADKALELARLAYPNDENLRMAYMLGLNAGTEWQAEKDTRDMYMSDTRNLQKVYELGKKDMKEQMLKDAVECELYWDGDFLAIDLNMRALGYSERDKVKVIVLKEGEE